MTCRGVRRRLSAYLDGELAAPDARRVGVHLEACGACAKRWQSLRSAMWLLGEVPRESSAGVVAARVLDRLEVESRGPGLALLFRPAWAARPLILPSLIPAALVLVTVLAGALALDRDPRPFMHVVLDRSEGRIAAFGTEANPLFPSASVGVPVIRDRGRFPETPRGEGSLFLETVVARDGSVSTVTLLEGDSEQARPYVDALRQERFEPARLRGRPVAISVYRLISRMEVHAAPPAI